MYTWQNSDLENIGNILLGTPSGTLNPYGYTIQTIILFLTDSEVNGEPLENPALGLTIDNAISCFFINNSDTQNLLVNSLAIPAGTPAINIPSIQGAPLNDINFKCETGATAMIVYQYKQIVS